MHVCIHVLYIYMYIYTHMEYIHIYIWSHIITSIILGDGVYMCVYMYISVYQSVQSLSCV